MEQRLASVASSCADARWREVVRDGLQHHLQHQREAQEHAHGTQNAGVSVRVQMVSMARFKAKN